MAAGMGSGGLGLGSLTSGWGYGSSYYNPYYAQPVADAAVPYDYSQPVVVNNYLPDAGGDGALPPQAVAETPESQQAANLFDTGLAQFKSGDYRGRVSNFDAALAASPGDPVVHEVCASRCSPWAITRPRPRHSIRSYRGRRAWTGQP